MEKKLKGEFIVAPDPDDQRLTKIVIGIDQDGREAQQRPNRTGHSRGTGPHQRARGTRRWTGRP